MKKLMLAAVFTAFAGAAANASLIVTAGNIPQIDDNVISGGSCVAHIDGPALLVQGCLNHSHSTLVNAQSDENIVYAAGGQAKIDATDKDGYSELSISVVGNMLSSLILNVEANANGKIEFTDGTTTSALFDIGKAGNNFFTLTGGPFADISFTTFDTTGKVETDIVDDTKQVRLGVASSGPICPPGTTGVFPDCHSIVVPEPASMLVLGAGLMGLGAVRRWRQH